MIMEKVGRHGSSQLFPTFKAPLFDGVKTDGVAIGQKPNDAARNRIENRILSQQRFYENMICICLCSSVYTPTIKPLNVFNTVSSLYVLTLLLHMLRSMDYSTTQP